jgi:16S rRNA (cytidine1402-2'-O)-methyltransferase
MAALAVSGLPTDEFLYVGFLPRKRSERRQRLGEVAAARHTIVAYEAPHRIVECLQDIGEILGNRSIAVSRELTKMHEEIVRGTVDDLLAQFTSIPPRGEFCLVIGGAAAEEAKAPLEQVKQYLIALKDKGVSGKDAVAEVAKATSMPKREVYKLWLELAR